MRCVVVATLIASSLCTSLPAEAGGLSEPSLPPQEVDIGDRKSRIADRVTRAMEELHYLRMKVSVRDHAVLERSGDSGTETINNGIEVITEMAPERLRTDVYTQGGKLKTCIAFDGARVQEFRPHSNFGGSRPLTEAMISYDAPHAYGTANTYLDTDERCLHGSYLGTWLGPDTRMARVLATKIERSKRVEEIDYNGMSAYRFLRVRRMEDSTTGEVLEVRETLIIDRTHWLPRELNSVQSGPAGVIERSRVFTILAHGDPPEETRWTIDPANPVASHWALSMSSGKETDQAEASEAK